MNFLRFNGGTLNGARVIAALALVSCTATASVSPDITYAHHAAATPAGMAHAVVAPTRTTFGFADGLVGAVDLAPISTHIHQISGEVAGSVEIIGYSLRNVACTGEFSGGASFDAIPASILGESAISGSAVWGVSATRIQFGTVEATGGASLVNGVEPTAIRRVLGDITATASLYIESGVNKVFEGYISSTASSSVLVQENGLLTKFALADSGGAAGCTAVPLFHHRASANLACMGAVFIAEPRIILGIFAECVGESSGNVIGTVTQSAMAHVAGEVDTLQNPVKVNINHASAASPQGGAVLDIAPTHIQMGAVSEIASRGFVLGDITYVFRGEGVCVGGVDISGDISYVHLGFADITGSGMLYPIGYERLMADALPRNTFIRPKTLRVFTRKSSNSFERT